MKLDRKFLDRIISNLREFPRKIRHFFRLKSISKKQKEKLDFSIDRMNHIIRKNNERMTNNFINIYNISLEERFQFKSFLLKYWKREITEINIIRDDHKYKIDNEKSNFKKGVIFDRNFLFKKIKILKISWGENIPSVSLKLNVGEDKGFSNEIYIMKKLTNEFLRSKKTPHIMMYINDYKNPSIGKNDINYYIDTWTERNSSFFMNESKEYKGLLSEYADLGNLITFLENRNITDKLCRQIFFQLLYTLMIIYEIYPNFYQGDFKIDNILVCSIVDIPSKYIKYKIYDTFYYLPCSGFQLRLWDFDRCNLGENEKQSSVNKDIDLFIKSFVLYYKKYLEKKETQETKDFINQISDFNITTKESSWGVELYNEKRNLENLKYIIWKESNYFTPYLKEPENGEILEYYNSEIISLYISKKINIQQNYVSKKMNIQ